MSATRHSHRAVVLAGRAAVHRDALTLSEARLWASLRGSRLGVGFGVPPLRPRSAPTALRCGRYSPHIHARSAPSALRCA
jgi:hypothetical protein